jgi:hypothetical protein
MRTIFNIWVFSLFNENSLILKGEEKLLSVKPILRIKSYGILVPYSSDITMCEPSSCFAYKQVNAQPY